MEVYVLIHFESKLYHHFHHHVLLYTALIASLRFVICDSSDREEVWSNEIRL